MQSLPLERPGPGVLPAPHRVHHFYEALLDDMLTFVGILAPDGTVIFVNNTPLRVAGLTLDDVVGQKFYDAPWWTHDPEVREAVRADVQRCAQGESLVHDLPIQVTGDRLMWIEFSMHPVFGDDGQVEYLIPEGRDIDDRRGIEEQLRRSEARGRAILRALPDTLVHYGPEGARSDPDSVLPPAAPLPFVIPDTRLQSLPASVAEGHRHAVTEALRTGQLQMFEYRCDGRDGSPRDVEARYVRHGDDEVLCILRDVTERRRLVEEKLELERRVLHRQKLESLGVLAGGIAHDFNNLLVGILGNADLVKGELDPESPAWQCLHDIEQAARQAAQLTGQMLDYAGKQNASIAPVDLNDLIRTTTPLLRVSTSHSVHVAFDLADRLPHVLGNASQLQQVVMNLVMNASEAIGPRQGTVRVSTATDHGRVRLEVTDDGDGMDAATRARLFEPFFTTKDHGRGLGMASVQGIVHSHDGTIRVDSEPGFGSRFTVHLPVTEAPLDATRQPPAPRGSASGQTLLVVDDERLVRNVLVRQLKRQGYQVVCAESGRGALELLRSRASCFTGVVLDQTLGDMRGDELLPLLRASCPETPVVLCTGFSERSMHDIFTGAHAPDAYLQKPFSRAALLAVLDQVFGDVAPA